jgi:oxalate decarboxylase/phosphoglucose isomerase-like protein (cupin superfamily)
MIFILDGRGSTTVWNDAGQRVTFEWKAGALFGIPMNCWHRHFNGSGQAPARYVAVTNAPPVINLYEDIEFVFNTTFDFKQRFNGEPDYFAAKAQADGLRLETNFIPDGVNVPVADTAERGAGSRMVRFNLAKGNIPGHISQFPVGTYKKAHAHAPGAHVVILTGEGYSLMWPDGDAPRRYEWQPGSLIVPPNMWLHQHFNTGPTPARYLAFKLGSQRNAQGVMTCWISKRLGRRSARLRLTRAHACAQCSRRRWRSTASRRAWRRPIARSSKRCRRCPARRRRSRTTKRAHSGRETMNAPFSHPRLGPAALQLPARPASAVHRRALRRRQGWQDLRHLRSLEWPRDCESRRG